MSGVDPREDAGRKVERTELARDVVGRSELGRDELVGLAIRSDELDAGYGETLRRLLIAAADINTADMPWPMASTIANSSCAPLTA